MSAYFLNIDDEGFLASDGTRLNDDAFGNAILSQLFIDNRIYKSKYEGRTCEIFAYDHPLIVQSVQKTSDGIKLIFPYNYSMILNFESLRLDEWDRFCGYNENAIPYVFSRKAQAQFFDLLDSFDDDSVNFSGKSYPMHSFLPDADNVGADDWNARYQTWQSTGNKPGWDLQGAHPAIKDILPQIKLNKASIAVMGAGAAHDAHYLAQLGHVVTAFDISAEAIAKAQQLYPETTTLKYVQCDLLNQIPEFFLGQFDLIFEHTFFCAINPIDRDLAMKAYRNLLHEEGHILGIFFLISLQPGPPFGATEWELKQRMDKHYRPLYWTRWNHSPEGREGWELMVYSQRLK